MGKLLILVKLVIKTFEVGPVGATKAELNNWVPLFISNHLTKDYIYNHGKDKKEIVEEDSWILLCGFGCLCHRRFYFNHSC